MSLARSATAFSCLALGLADLLYLNLAMVPALFMEVPSAGATEPARAVQAEPTEPEPAAPEPTAPEPTAPEPAAPEPTAIVTPLVDPAPASAAPAPSSTREEEPAARAWSVIVHFARDRDELTERAQASLSRAAARLTANPSAVARIEGHTDRVGESTHNLELSQRRAERVADHLAGLGVAPERMTVRGLGESRPLERAPEADAHRRNRRVEVHIVPADGARALRAEEGAP